MLQASPALAVARPAQVGDTLEKGQILCVLESMKMVLALAPVYRWQCWAVLGLPLRR